MHARTSLLLCGLLELQCVTEYSTAQVTDTCTDQWSVNVLQLLSTPVAVVYSRHTDGQLLSTQLYTATLFNSRQYQLEQECSLMCRCCPDVYGTASLHGVRCLTACMHVTAPWDCVCVART